MRRPRDDWSSIGYSLAATPSHAPIFVSMCVRVCVCVQLCVRVCAYESVCVHVCVQVCTSACECVFIWENREREWASVWLYVCVNVCKYMIMCASCFTAPLHNSCACECVRKFMNVCRMWECVLRYVEIGRESRERHLRMRKREKELCQFLQHAKLAFYSSKVSRVKAFPIKCLTANGQPSSDAWKLLSSHDSDERLQWTRKLKNWLSGSAFSTCSSRLQHSKCRAFW